LALPISPLSFFSFCSCGVISFLVVLYLILQQYFQKFLLIFHLLFPISLLPLLRLMLRLASLAYLSTLPFLFLLLRGYYCPGFADVAPFNESNTDLNVLVNSLPIPVKINITTTEINAKIFQALPIFSPLPFSLFALAGLLCFCCFS
ncbi:hypothetical protein ABGF26_08360, partial [Helcococcus ovis]|uniref:hypothetical protein n=1 Tax=Helcococcus ovis TaxID=72026 RepID=UPI0038B7EA96